MLPFSVTMHDLILVILLVASYPVENPTDCLGNILLPLPLLLFPLKLKLQSPSFLCSLFE